MSHHAHNPLVPLAARPTDLAYRDQLVGSLKRAPWLGISLGFHALLFLLLHNMVWSVSRQKEEQVLVSSAEPEEVEVFEPPIPPDPDPVPDPVDPVREDPVVSEDDILPLDQADVDLAPLAPFESRQLNDVIGAGGGAGGGFGTGWRRRSSRGGAGSLTERSVDAGLDWLSRHQEGDGSWDCDDFGRNSTSPLNDGRGNAHHDVGVTALALLAFMGAGSTSEVGQYKKVVKDGLRWLQSRQDRDDGCFGSRNHPQFLYGHALATLAMVEGYHLSGVPLFRGPAQRAVHFVQRARNPYRAWRYAAPPDGENDSSITGWMLFALHAARDAGLEVDDRAIEDGMAFLNDMTDPTTGRTGYRETGSAPAREAEAAERWPAEQSESLTAVACLCRIFDGEDPDRSAALKAGADLIVRRLPRWDEDAGCIDFYSWYYGSYVMWQMSGRYWDQWQKALLSSIVKHQRGGEGDERGSWDPQVDPWGEQGGRVYSTAINVLCLEVYYRYDHVLGSRTPSARGR